MVDLGSPLLEFVRRSFELGKLRSQYLLSNGVKEFVFKKHSFYILLTNGNVTKSFMYPYGPEDLDALIESAFREYNITIDKLVWLYYIEPYYNFTVYHAGFRNYHKKMSK